MEHQAEVKYCEHYQTLSRDIVPIAVISRFEKQEIRVLNALKSVLIGNPCLSLSRYSLITGLQQILASLYNGRAW